MTGLFKSNNPTSVFFLLIYALVLKFPLFINALPPISQASDAFFYKIILHVIKPVSATIPFIYNLLTFLLIFIQAIYFNRVANAQHLHKQANYLYAMSYLLITSLLANWFSFSAVLINSTIAIWIWSKLCTLYNSAMPKTTIFNIGLATGIATLTCTPFIIFLIWIMVGIGIARPFRIQEWLIGLAGMLTPLYIIIAFLFITDKIGQYNMPAISFYLPRTWPAAPQLFNIVLLVFTTGIGIFYVINNMRRQLVLTRKSWQLLFLFSTIALLLLFINNSNTGANSYLLALPVAAIVSAVFYYPQKKIIPIFFHVSMVLAYLFNFFISK